MAEPGVEHRNQTELFYYSKAGSVFPCRTHFNSSRRGRETPNRFATSNSRLGDAALTVRRAIGQRQIVPAACPILEHLPKIRRKTEPTVLPGRGRARCPRK